MEKRSKNQAALIPRRGGWSRPKIEAAELHCKPSLLYGENIKRRKRAFPILP